MTCKFEEMSLFCWLVTGTQTQQPGTFDPAGHTLSRSLPSVTQPSAVNNNMEKPIDDVLIEILKKNILTMNYITTLHWSLNIVG